MNKKQLKIDFLTPQKEELYSKPLIKPTNTKLFKFFILDRWQNGIKKALVYSKDISYVEVGMMIRDSRKPTVKKVVEPDEVKTIRQDARWELCSETLINDVTVVLDGAPIIHNHWFTGVLQPSGKIIFKHYI